MKNNNMNDRMEDKDNMDEMITRVSNSLTPRLLEA